MALCRRYLIILNSNPMKLFQPNGALCGLLLVASLCCSCEEKFDLDSSQLSDAIALDGLITNENPPYFFRLTHVASVGLNNNENETGVVDAQIVVTDETAGIKDTLKLLEPIYSIYHPELEYYNYYTGKKEVQSVGGSNDPTGIYVTTKIYGIENHRYTLDLYYRGKHHTAQETMVPKTPITDMKLKEVDLGVKGKTWAPCISFVNSPDEENYYLFKLNSTSMRSYGIAGWWRFYGAHHYWPFSILSDEHLEEKVVDFVVSEGEQRWGAPGISYPFSDSTYVCIQSISKACYDCYDDMIQQLRSDGGAYTPRPVGVKSNISGGVLGLFRVSALSERYVLADTH